MTLALTRSAVVLLAISCLGASHRPPVCTEVKGAEDRITGYDCPKGSELRLWRALSSIDKNLQDTVVFMEDAKFWMHKGVDADEMVNSLQKDLKEGKLARGGSTITQQLARNLYLSNEKSFVRKLRELQIAVQLEKDLSKKEILESYLNTIEWGPGFYGVEMAARTYFDRTAEELTAEQVWLLTLMIPNPRELCLWFRPKARKSLLNRAQRLTERLWQDKRMSKDEAEELQKRFLVFLDEWEASKPVLGVSEGRHFPAVWDESVYGRQAKAPAAKPKAAK